MKFQDLLDLEDEIDNWTRVNFGNFEFEKFRNMQQWCENHHSDHRYSFLMEPAGDGLIKTVFWFSDPNDALVFSIKWR